MTTAAVTNDAKASGKVEWYTFFSSKVGREYFFHPDTNEVVWTLPPNAQAHPRKTKLYPPPPKDSELGELTLSEKKATKGKKKKRLQKSSSAGNVYRMLWTLFAFSPSLLIGVFVMVKKFRELPSAAFTIPTELAEFTDMAEMESLSQNTMDIQNNSTSTSSTPFEEETKGTSAAQPVDEVAEGSLSRNYVEIDPRGGDLSGSNVEGEDSGTSLGENLLQGNLLVQDGIFGEDTANEKGAELEVQASKGVDALVNDAGAQDDSIAVEKQTLFGVCPTEKITLCNENDSMKMESEKVDSIDQETTENKQETEDNGDLTYSDSFTKDLKEEAQTQIPVEGVEDDSLLRSSNKAVAELGQPVLQQLSRFGNGLKGLIHKRKDAHVHIHNVLDTMHQ